MDKEVEEGQRPVKGLVALTVGIEGPSRALAIGIARQGLIRNPKVEATIFIL